MNSGFAHTASGYDEHGLGHPGLPRETSAVPMLREVTLKRSRSTPVVASAHPSATSPDDTLVFRTTLTSEMSAVRSGSPPAGGTQVHCAVHLRVTQLALSAPSHCSRPSRMPLPHTVAGDTVRL